MFLLGGINMDQNKERKVLSDEEMDLVTGGAWTGNELELYMVCANEKCRCVRRFVRGELCPPEYRMDGKWHCEVCMGTETCRWQDL